LIRQECPAVALVAGEHKTENVPVRSATNAGRFLTLGVTPEYLQLRNLWLAAGRHPSASDLSQRRRVAVLGNSVREQLFGQRTDVIGETIRIRGYPYRVIGYMSAKNQNSSYDGWDNDKIIVPATTLTRDAPADRPAYRDGRLATIIYQPVSADRWAEAEAQVKAALGRAHGFDPRDKSAIGIWDTVEAAQLFDRVFDSMEIFLSVIALVTMSLGGVGVMNMMMMAVTERTNEIGLKKALGATRRRVLLEFFLDGVALALLAGVAGLLLVLALSAVVNSLPMPAMFAGLPIGWSNLLVAAAALGAVAVASALPPAYRAAKLTPVEALRYEK